MRALLVVFIAVGCSSSEEKTSTEPSVDAAPAEVNDGCPVPEIVGQLGDTCVSFGVGTPCDVCGLPQYGYVCTNGRPDVPGCVRVRPESVVAGATYCCTELRCVRVPMLDGECAGAKMVQCPDAVEAPAGCTRADVSSPYRWFCCP